MADNNKITGAEMVIKCLEKEGVEVVFGIPGGAILPIYDALLNGSVRHILVRHEQCAAHAADGYARATGKTGVCMATSGPGATNLLTGIANAYMDSIPIVAITGQVAINKIGTDAFQETDTVGITAPITKHNYLVLDVKEIPQIIKEAFYIASTGRPGPVVIDIPINIMKSLVDKNIQAEVKLPGYKPTYKGNLFQIKQAANLISKSKSPAIIAGGGIISSGASDILIKFAQKYKIPVANTLLGLGSFPGDGALSLGMIGIYGAKHINFIFSEVDLIIAAGVRFSDRVAENFLELVPKAKIIHIDIDPAEIGKIFNSNVPIVGDAKNVIDDLYNACNTLSDIESIKKRNEWLKRVDVLTKKYPFQYDEKSKELKSAYIVEKIYEITKGDAIICTEVGQHQMWTAQFYKFKNPRTFVTSGGLGAMGFGLPAAIGAKVGIPQKQVIDIAGDGSIQMVIQELATAVKNDIKIKIMVLNNGCLGMVKQLQQFYCDGRHSQVDISGSVDFVKIIEAYGGTGFRVRKKDEVEDTIKKALDIDGVALVDFWIDREENVTPNSVNTMPQTIK